MSEDPENPPESAEPTENAASVLPLAPLGPDPNLPEIRPAPARVHRDLTPERREKFLDALRECGVVAEAARRASSGRETSSTFYDARRRDPEFAAAWDEAINEALGKIETALFQRATTGMIVRQKFDADGRLLGEDRVFSDNAGIAILRVRDAAWRDALSRREVDVTARGEVQHQHQHQHAHAHAHIAKNPELHKLLKAMTTDELQAVRQLQAAVRRITGKAHQPPGLPAGDAVAEHVAPRSSVEDALESFRSEDSYPPRRSEV